MSFLQIVIKNERFWQIIKYLYIMNWYRKAKKEDWLSYIKDKVRGPSVYVPLDFYESAIPKRVIDHQKQFSQQIPEEVFSRELLKSHKGAWNSTIEDHLQSVRSSSHETILEDRLNNDPILYLNRRLPSPDKANNMNMLDYKAFGDKEDTSRLVLEKQLRRYDGEVQ